MPPRKNAYYDDDDIDDGYDDDDYGDWDEDEAPAPKAPAGKQAPAKATAGKAGSSGSAAPRAPAAASGASTLARTLCDPPPLKPSGKPQLGVKPEPAAVAKHAPSYPPTPAATAAARHAGPAFDFSTPSPDDRVLAAQRGEVGSATAAPAKGAHNQQPAAGSAAAGGQPLPQRIFLPQSKAVMGKTEVQGPAAAAPSAGVAGLSLGSSSQAGAGAAAAAGSSGEAEGPLASRPRISAYKPDPALEKECAAAAAAEVSGADTNGPRPQLHLVVLGHVDAGKSTLMGRLLADLGVVSARDVAKNQRDAAAAGKGSFAWAWLLDERPEERARGVTVDVATTRFTTPRYAVTLLDAPGHRDFVPNMIGGAAQADAALLLVDGSPGGFEAGFEGGGQTCEHAQLARSLGVEQLAVVVSKLDTCGYAQERFEAIKAQLAPYLRSPCGYKDSQIQWLPAVGPSGQNLVAPPTEPGLAAWWGTGPTLVQAIDMFTPRERLTGKPLRMPVADASKGGAARGGGGGGAGSVTVSGKLEAGALRVGSKVMVMPGGESATVKGLEVDGQAVSLARAGSSADVVLVGLSEAGQAGIGTGSCLCAPNCPVPVATRFEARVVVLDIPVPILKGAACTLHAGVSRTEARLEGLVALLDARTAQVTKQRPRCLTKGVTAVVEVAVAGSGRGVCVEEYADLRPLGRIALRDGGRTLAVGVITRLVA